ncbi:tetratricopeptide repeat protein [candidate division WOR-3 bacterium]|nr:tetratricopeptide repeat protein [candidate division WOR-3 bacterium]
MQGSTPIFLRKNSKEKFGSFEGSVVNSDIAEFTQLTENLSSHGKKGVRIITFILDNFYETVFKKTKKYGGHVISLSGDSYTAVFPGRNSLVKGIYAGFEIKREIERSKFITPDGESGILLRTAVSKGEISWLSFGKKSEEFCVFSGDPVFSVFYAQKKTPKGGFSIIARKSALSDILAEYPKIGEIGKNILMLGDKRGKRKKLFCEKDYAGSREGKPSSEFRHAGCVFLKIKTVKREKEALHISEDVLKMSSDFGGYLNDVEATEDGVVYFILFGAPLSRSGDLRRACDFMLTVRKKYPRNSSSSLVSGKIFAGYFSMVDKYRYAVNGEAINLSSRILKKAKAGDCLLDVETASGLRDKFCFTPLKKHKFKGVRDKVSILNLVKAKKKKLRLQMRNDLIKKIINIISSSKERTIIELSGESGMGKSSVIDGLCESLGGRYSVIKLTGDDLKKDSFQPIKNYLSGTLIISGFRTPLSKKRAFEKKYSEIENLVYCREKNKTKALEQKEEMKTIKPFIGNICGITKYNPFPEKYDPLKIKSRIMSSIISFLSVYMKGKKQILFFDDADKLDFETADLVQKMLAYELFDKTIFVFAYEKEIAFLKKNSGIKTFHFKLAKFSREKTRYAAEVLFGEKIDGKLQDFIYRKSLGNPIIIEELCMFLKTTDRAFKKNSKWTFSGDETDIAGNMFSLIAGRIDGIQNEYRQTLNASAVLGMEFEKDELVLMLNIKKDADVERWTEKALDYFEKEKLIFLSEGTVKFRHSLIRETVYEMLPLTSLESEHRFAAMALEKKWAETDEKQREIALHWEASENYEKASICWQKAAEHYRHSYDFQGTVFSAVRELKCLEKCEKKDDGKIIKTMCLLGEDLLFMYSLNEAEYYITSSLERYRKTGISDIDILFDIYRNLGNLAKKKGDCKKSISFFRSAYRLLPFGVEDSRKNRILRDIGDVYSVSEDYKKSMRFIKLYLFKVEKNSEAITDKFEALNSMGSALINLGELKEAIIYLDRAVRLAKEEGFVEDHSLAHALNNLGVAYYYLGDYEKSAFFNFGALDVFTKIYGTKNNEVAFLMSNIGGLLNKMKKYEEARKYLIRAADIYRKIGMSLHSDAIRVYVNLGYTHFSRKNYRQAADCYRRVIKLSKAGTEGENMDVAVSYSFLGKIEIEKNNYDNASEYFKKSLRIFNKTCGKDSIYTAYVYGSMAQIFLYKSEKAKSLKFSERSYLLFRKTLGDENEDSVFAALSYAEALANSGQISSAKKVFERINRNEISDPELLVKIKNLSRKLLCNRKSR